MRWRRYFRTAGRQRGDGLGSGAAGHGPKVRRGRSASPTRSLSIWGALLYLGSLATIGFAQEMVEIPPGREAAAPAPRGPLVAPPAPARPLPAPAAPAAEGRSVLDLLGDALGQNDDPNVRNLERQFLPQFQQLLKTELAFVYRVCEPDQEKLLEVAISARERLGIAVRRYAVAQNQMRQRRVRDASPAGLEPLTLIQQQVAAIVDEKLRPEQAGRYEEECAHRTARRKRAVVLNLVARLDEDLRLTTDQREQLARSLTAGYQESWAQWLQLLAHEAQIMPHIPDHCILPALSEGQKAVWRQTSKSGPVLGGLPFAPAMMVIEDAVLEEF